MHDSPKVKSRLTHVTPQLNQGHTNSLSLLQAKRLHQILKFLYKKFSLQEKPWSARLVKFSQSFKKELVSPPQIVPRKRREGTLQTHPTEPVSPIPRLNENTIKKEEYKPVCLNINTKFSQIAFKNMLRTSYNTITLVLFQEFKVGSTFAKSHMYLTNK